MAIQPQRAQEVFAVVAAVPAAERASVLARLCAGDEELRRWVELLLRARDGVAESQSIAGALTVTSGCAPGSLGDTRSLPPAADGSNLAPGAVIAVRYTLVRLLGEGGMGEVWVADQSEPVKRQVALKLIRGGMDSRAVAQRFEAERQALALMDHPNIARVFDGGTTADRRPFFVMELVQGQPLTRFCDDGRLSPRQRLELFVPICQAVQHAHQKGIVHRDLKPSNILVTVTDGVPTPKVIDFGVAKATAGRLTEATMATAFGAVVGTLEYMAPEQAGQTDEDVDTRADVYSLGVILYELLTGLRPIDARRLQKAALLEMIRMIQEEEPVRPSTRLSTEEALPSLAAVRQTEPRKLMSMLRGELDCVVMKCLEKSRERRYETANSLARDIQRYLAHEPIEARPPSPGYRLAKFARRNRAAVAAAGAVVATLLLATGVSIRFALGEATQRRLADANAAAEVKARKRSDAVTAFVTAALDSSDPMRTGRQDTTIAEAMTRAIAEIEAGTFADDPETEAALRNTIGLILENNGRLQEARPLLEQGLAMRERLLAGDHPDIATSLHNLASLAMAQGRLAEARTLRARSLAMFERLGGLDADVAAELNGLAALHYLEGQFDAAEPLFERALAIREAVLRPNHRDLALTLNDFALLHAAKRNFAEATRMLQRSLAIYEQTLGPDHPDVAASLNSMATVYDDQGQPALALPLYLRALAICEKALGPDHAIVATALANLAGCHRLLEQYAEAEPLYRRALAIREEVLGPNHADVAVVLNNLALVCKAQRRFAEAEALYHRTLAIDEALFGPEHAEVGVDLHNIGALYAAQDEFGKAVEFYGRALAIRERALGPDHHLVGATLNNLAMVHHSRNEFAPAEPLAQRAVTIFRGALGADHPMTAEVGGNLARILHAMGRTAEARQGFDQAIRGLRAHSPDGSPALARLLWRSAQARLDGVEVQGWREARGELEQAVALAKRLLSPGHPNHGQFAEALARCKAVLGEPVEAGGK